jgi:glucose uptake protein GlcU
LAGFDRVDALASHEPALYRAHATLVSFNGGAYLATIQLTRSPSTTIANVPVSRAIGAGSLVVGATVAVLFFDHNNSADAMIVGVY